MSIVTHCESAKLEDISKLVPHPRNPNKHSESQIKALAKIIDYQGWRSPIVVSNLSGFIIAGHGRYQAAQLLGLKKVPVNRQDFGSEADEWAHMIADNRIAELAELDSIELGGLMRDLDMINFDLSLTGFDEIGNLLELPGTEGLTDEDDVPEVPEVPIAELGDVWVLGNHRLMCGDSTSREAVEKLMDGKKADMVFTDPPYGVEFQSNMRTKSAKFDVLKNDDTFLDIAPIIEACSTGWVFVWTSWKVLTKWIDQFQSMGYPTNIVVWHKPGGGIGDLKHTFSSDYEVGLVWHRGAELCGKRIGSVWTVNKDGVSTYVHPTQKPVALAVEALDKTTRVSASVLDLFGGSGSTLIACEKTNRHCRMMELDTKYCDVIINRWQAFTGKQATNEATGNPFHG
jgi:DNA modification methylase